MTALLKTILIFVFAGICEIGGGYLIWQWLKNGKPVWMALVGALVLIIYGIVATLQTANFAKVYATYGGFFVVLSLIWAMIFDRYQPSKFDVIGSVVVLIGVCIIYWGSGK